MSLYIDMKMTRPVKFSGVTLNLDCNSWTLWQSCNVVNPGKTFHWLTINCVQSSVFWWTFEQRQLVFPHRIWMLVSDSPFQDMTQNLKIRKPSRARDWWLLHHWPKMIVSMKSLIVRLSTFQICQTSVSWWDPFLYFGLNVNFLRNSSPWIQMLPMLKTKTFPKKKKFVAVLHCISWRLVQHLSHSIIHPVQEWSRPKRKVWFCDGVRVHITVINNKSFRVLSEQSEWLFINRSPCSQMLLIARAQRYLTFISGFPRVLWCSRR